MRQLNERGTFLPGGICHSPFDFYLSLGTFSEIYRKRIDKQIIVHPKGFSESDGIIKIPPYMMHLI
jgi:hypothetical protein